MPDIPNSPIPPQPETASATPDNNKPHRWIFTAELDANNQITTMCYSKHLPSLSFVKDILQAEITRAIIDDKIKQQMAAQGKIIPAGGAGLIQYLRGVGKGRRR